MDGTAASSNLPLIVEEPLVLGPLALYPLLAAAPGAPTYLTGPEAERLGVLRVAEKPGGATVPEMVVHNTSALPLLLLEGETLVGAKQNRTLDVSVLVPAQSTAAILVTCVEAGRWGAPRASSRSLRHAPADLRRVKTSTIALPSRRAMKQSAVWDRVSRYQHELDASSPTSALEDVAELRAGEVERLVLGARPSPDQCGVAVAIGGSVKGFDCFDKPATLAAYWDGLVAGYALDALRSRGGIAPARAEVQSLVGRALDAARTAIPTTGLGTTCTFVGTDVVGSELAWHGINVHISAFVEDTAGMLPSVSLTTDPPPPTAPHRPPRSG